MYYSLINFYVLEQAHEDWLYTSLIFSADLNHSTHLLDRKMCRAIVVLQVETLRTTSLCWNANVQFVLVLGLIVLLQKGMCSDLWLMSTNLIWFIWTYTSGVDRDWMIYNIQTKFNGSSTAYQPRNCLRNVKYAQRKKLPNLGLNSWFPFQAHNHLIVRLSGTRPKGKVLQSLFPG